MGRVYPSTGQATSSSAAAASSLVPSPYITSEREVFTIWMKSILLNGNGCTVFNANGDIIYRIDNYNCKCNREVYLMNLRGSVLFTILNVNSIEW
ncbi:hypothetical protein AQUCO_02000587v1 [Aquilegia coerulea]|uniref:Uncharacterized protein n=1 Tax=Aquilegia coerulea TaxID=218851 RepID=A0A2G5DI96_AQUCA|nr:hypothetical protein AQUCO_02000587v1 [Aquilegia coerulea]